MPDIRPINEKKYEISKHRFLELYHYCLQYPEWIKELKGIQDTVKGISYDGVKVSGGGHTNVTENLAIRREKLRQKCEVIEQTAIEADPDIYQWILEGVTTEYATYRYLKDAKGIPCGQTMYYNRRRKFFWILSQKI